MEFIENLKSRAKQNKRRIVLPEGEEERNLKAADQVLAEGFAEIILIGNPETIKSNAKNWNLTNIDKALIVNPKDHDKREAYINLLVELRKSKGMTVEQASKLVED